MRIACAACLMALVSAFTACSASARYASAALPTQALASSETAAPPPLDHSLFARHPGGQLSEADLQTILDSPLELDLPARVGVLPVVTARDFRGPGPDDAIPAGLHDFCDALRASDHFTLVSEILPIPSGALGMEALRELAARYRLRYIVLYREHYQRRERKTAWAFGYLTLLGTLFLPGEDLRVDGMLEASLFDVKTGLLLYTVRRSITSQRSSTVWYQTDKLAAMERKLASLAAPELAQDVWLATTHLAAAMAVENQRRVAALPSPTAAPLQPTTTVATP